MKSKKVKSAPNKAARKTLTLKPATVRRVCRTVQIHLQSTHPFSIDELQQMIATIAVGVHHNVYPVSEIKLTFNASTSEVR